MDAFDTALAAALGTLPDDWEFHGLSADDMVWQAMAYRERDNAWAVGRGRSPGAALEALRTGDLRVIPALAEGDDFPPIHPTVDLVRNGESIGIDAELAPLMEAIWQAGLATISSCQRGLGGKAVIDFDTVEDAAVFLAIVARDFSVDQESLWNRMFVETEPEDWQRFRRERVWTYHVSADDYSVDHEAEPPVRTRPPAIDFRAGVAFPPSDIAEVTKLVLEHNAANLKA